jgi:hypothetical protein
VTIAPSACGCAGVIRELNKVETYIEHAAAVPEFAIMMRMGRRLHEAALGEWTERANVAIAKMVRAAPATLTEAFLTSVPGRLQSGFGKSWPPKALKDLTTDVVTETYRLSKQVIAKKDAGRKAYQKPLVFKADTAAIAGVFTVLDEEAVAYLAESQVFWLGQHFDATTVEAIRDAGWIDLAGRTGKEAGEALRRKAEHSFGVGAFAAHGNAYFQGVAINAATTARVTSAVFEMRDLGITRYRIVSVLDERTTPICVHLDGKLFSVEDAAARMDQIVRSGTPQGVKDLHPWRPNDFLDDLDAVGVDLKPGVQLSDAAAVKTAEAGFGFPPYHFGCRTTVDIE